MDFSKVSVQFIEHGNNGSNIYVALGAGATFGVFRIYYTDHTRKGARNKDLRAKEIYFEGFDKLPNKNNLFLSYEVEKVTNLMLFAERRKQWIFETAIDKHEKQKEERIRESLKAKPAPAELP